MTMQVHIACQPPEMAQTIELNLRLALLNLLPPARSASDEDEREVSDE